MKNHLLLLAILFVGLSSCEKTNEEDQRPVQVIEFKDSNFLKALIESGLDKNGDGKISISEVSWVSELDVSGNKIFNIDEIKHFTALVRLDCNDNQLISLDLSGCSALRTLHCNNNCLTSLDLSGCFALTVILQR